MNYSARPVGSWNSSHSSANAELCIESAISMMCFKNFVFIKWFRNMCPKSTNLFVGINTLVTFLGRSWLMRRMRRARETSLATRHSIFPISREGSCYPQPTALLETRNFSASYSFLPFLQFCVIRVGNSSPVKWWKTGGNVSMFHQWNSLSNLLEILGKILVKNRWITGETVSPLTG